MNSSAWAARLACLWVTASVLAGCAASSQPAPAMEGQRFGLVSSLPIYRAPRASVADALAADGSEDVHWLRTELEADNTLEPIDQLDTNSLEQTDILLLVQPRALTPGENVTLDEWVRAGGKVLLVADPMLVSEPRFALGDPRNPQAISVTGTILARWGLELQPGISGDEAERSVQLGGETLPVAFGGSFAARPPAGGDPADCELRNQALVAVCAIGKGRAVLVADATLFEIAPMPERAPEIFWSMVGIFGDDPTE